jgi:hypothetical protein
VGQRRDRSERMIAFNDGLPTARKFCTASGSLFTILPTDVRWNGRSIGVEEGPQCTCSRCGKAIEEPDVAIRMWPADGVRFEYRFHPRCLGAETYDGPDDEDDDA